MKRILLAFAVLFVVCVYIFAEDEVLSVSGLSKTKIEEISTDSVGNLCVAAGGTQRTCEEVISLRFENAMKKVKYPVVVMLVNGDRIGGKITGGDKESLTIETDSFGKLPVKFDKLRAVFVPENISEKGFIASKAALNNTSDEVFLKEGGTTDGVVDKITQDGVAIKVKSLGTTVTLGYDKIAGVLLALVESYKKPEGLIATVFTTDGSTISGRIKAMKGEQITIDSILGAGFVVKKSEVDSIYFSGGKFTYLSDIKTSAVSEVPYFDNFLYPYQVDKNLEAKNPISVRGLIYRKGICAHSKTELTYDVNGEYSVFYSKLAIEDEAKGKGNVTFVIYGDDKELKKVEDITGKSEPAAVRIDIKGVKKLKLVVEFGKGLDTMDRAVFADAVLIK